MEKIDNIKDIDTFYSQKVIPLAFNESLSYMEQICTLIDYIENTLVPTLNEHTDAINELQIYVKMLKDLLDKLDKKVDDNFITLDTKIDTTKEELINIINGINEILTKAIQDLDTKVVNHINVANEKFNKIDSEIGTINSEIETINTEIGTINEQIETLDNNVTQNTNDIEDIKPKTLTDMLLRSEMYEHTYAWEILPYVGGSYPFVIENNTIQYKLSYYIDFKIKDEYLNQELNKENGFNITLTPFGEIGKNAIINKSFNTFGGFVQNLSTKEISYIKFRKIKNNIYLDTISYIYFTPTEQNTRFNIFIDLNCLMEE